MCTVKATLCICPARIYNSLYQFIMRIDGLIVSEVDMTNVKHNARATEHNAAVSRLRTEALLPMPVHGVLAPDCDSLTSTVALYAEREAALPEYGGNVIMTDEEQSN